MLHTFCRDAAVGAGAFDGCMRYQARNDLYPHPAASRQNVCRSRPGDFFHPAFPLAPPLFQTLAGPHSVVQKHKECQCSRYQSSVYQIKTGMVLNNNRSAGTTARGKAPRQQQSPAPAAKPALRVAKGFSRPEISSTPLPPVARTVFPRNNCRRPDRAIHGKNSPF